MNGVYIQFWPTLLILKQIILTCTHLSQCKSSIVYSSEPVQEQHSSRVWARSRAALFTRLSPFKSSIVHSSEPVQEQHCLLIWARSRAALLLVWARSKAALCARCVTSSHARPAYACNQISAHGYFVWSVCWHVQLMWHRYSKIHVTSLHKNTRDKPSSCCFSASLPILITSSNLLACILAQNPSLTASSWIWVHCQWSVGPWSRSQGETSHLWRNYV